MDNISDDSFLKTLWSSLRYTLELSDLNPYRSGSVIKQEDDLYERFWGEVIHSI
jgi:hypothetical protein